MKSEFGYRWSLSLLLISLVGGYANAQSDASHQHESSDGVNKGGSLTEQVEALRSKVRHLEQLLMEKQESSDSMKMGSGGGMEKMKMMKGKGMGMGGSMSKTDGDASGGMKMGSGSGMGMMKMMKGKGMGMGGSMSKMEEDSSGGMKMGSGGGMGMMKMMKGKGMGMMGMMKGMGSDAMMISALPGFPGASHLYHIGATDFFLDHGDHLNLEREQIARINQIREKATLGGATSDRQVEEAEQELWELTAADEPEASKIESKIRDIERIKGEQRIGFIRSVGKAAKVLSEGQIQLLIGEQSTESEDGESSHQH